MSEEARNLIQDGGQPGGAVSPVTSPYLTHFDIKRTWAVLPGAVLVFPLRMYLSGELSKARENTIGLSPVERDASLLNFRIRVLSDVLYKEPSGFPDFPEKANDGSTDLRARAVEFFSRKDENGFYIFGLLVEDVITEYWQRALPSPILPASVS